MRHGSTAVRPLPVYFVRNVHSWVDISSVGNYNRVKCTDCKLIAIQDKGSLGYFVVDCEEECAYLSCDELIIKNIIE